MTPQASGSKCKEPGWLLGLSIVEVVITNVDNNASESNQSCCFFRISCRSWNLNRVRFTWRYVCCRWLLSSSTWSQQTSECLWTWSQSWIKACSHNTARAYTESGIGQVVIFLINQTIEMEELYHHLLCPMLHCLNGVLINEVPKFLAPISSETTHAKQLENPFDATHPIIIPLK